MLLFMGNITRGNLRVVCRSKRLQGLLDNPVSDECLMMAENVEVLKKVRGSKTGCLQYYRRKKWEINQAAGRYIRSHEDVQRISIRDRLNDFMQAHCVELAAAQAGKRHPKPQSLWTRPVVALQVGRCTR